MVPRVEYLYLQASLDDATASVSIITPSMEVGYAWIWNHFVMNAGGGLGYAFLVGEDIYEDRININLILNFSIGFVI